MSVVDHGLRAPISRYVRLLLLATAFALLALFAVTSNANAAIGVSSFSLTPSTTTQGANPNLAISVLIQNVAGSILYEYGSPEQRDLARGTIAGERMVAITVTEPEAGNDVQNVKTSATAATGSSAGSSPSSRSAGTPTCWSRSPRPTRPAAGTACSSSRSTGRARGWSAPRSTCT